MRKRFNQPVGLYSASNCKVRFRLIATLGSVQLQGMGYVAITSPAVCKADSAAGGYVGSRVKHGNDGWALDTANRWGGGGVRGLLAGNGDANDRGEGRLSNDIHFELDTLVLLDPAMDSRSEAGMTEWGAGGRC